MVKRALNRPAVERRRALKPRGSVAVLALLASASGWSQDVSVYGMTLAQVWKAETPGFSQATYAPATQYLGIDASDVVMERLSLHLFGWGRADLADRSSALAWVRSVIAQAATRRDFRVCVEITSTEPAYRSVLARQIAEIVEGLAGVHDFFARAASDPQGLDAAKAHLFIATMMERSDFIAVGEEWFARDHLEQIMTDWLIALTR